MRAPSRTEPPPDRVREEPTYTEQTTVDGRKYWMDWTARSRSNLPVGSRTQKRKSDVACQPWRAWTQNPKVSQSRGVQAVG
eukprot:COSAG01_NODE_843_length_13172_cov_84.009791_9_plen_81_part_00